MRRLFLVLGILAATAVDAQESAEISGLVRDNNQAAIAGVRVTVINQLTRSEGIFYTDNQGFYRAGGLEPQYYTVEAFRPGFQTVVKRDVSVGPRSRLRLDLELSPAAPGRSIPAPGTLGYLFLSALIPALVLLLITEPSRKVLQKLWRPVEWLADKFYELCASRSPDWIGLPGYRKRVLRDPILGRIEHPVGPGESQDFKVTLDQAFAPLAVITADGDDRIDLFRFAATNRRFLVLGGPGSGKTTLMKNLLISILNRSCHQDLNALIPVFVVLREMASAGHGVEEAIESALSSFRFKRGGRFVKSALEGGRVLIILDGLDEVGASREAVSGRIRQFCVADEQRRRPNHLIVTCRENSYRTRDLADVIPTLTRIEPFSPQHMRTFLQGWPAYKGRVPLKLYTQIQADAQIRDICRNPLLLTLLTGLYLAKEKFDLPSSRDSFYRTAIDELLAQRPARKQQHQDYTDTYKWQILQRISLDRLETIKPGEDPEVLKRDRLFEFAKQVLGDDLKEADFQKLLLELENVNSILKPIGEGSFVLGHRTFQEYLAAVEANRTLETSKIISRFRNRPELSEVLCFYCGLIRKIPEINSILDGVLKAEDPLLAGRCLLNVLETPSEQVISQIVLALVATVRTADSHATELDLLSSLAQRAQPEFEVARRGFSDAIEAITRSSGRGSAGFVSALSVNPELAMKLIPGLLKHKSSGWRIQAVELLSNLGTDEALVQLVQLMESEGGPERIHAAILVSNLIRSRNAELKRCSTLLRERGPSHRIWPFEDYFPGRIAIAILEALGTESFPDRAVTRNRCINEALRRRDKHTAKWDCFRWENVGAYLKMNSYRKQAMTVLSYFGLTACLILAVTIIGLYVECSLRKQVISVEFWPLRVARMPNRNVFDLTIAADRVYKDIERRYPTASGWARVLPWNWEAKPVVPAEAKRAVENLNMIWRPSFRPDEEFWTSFELGLSTLPAPPGEIAILRDAGQVARRTFPRSSNRASLFVSGLPPNVRNLRWFDIYITMTMIVSFVSFNYLVKIAKTERLRFFGRSPLVYKVFPPRSLALLCTLFPLTFMNSFSPKPWLLLALFLAIVLGPLTAKVEFPRNHYMKLVEELRPLSDGPDTGI